MFVGVFENISRWKKFLPNFLVKISEREVVKYFFQVSWNSVYTIHL